MRHYNATYYVMNGHTLGYVFDEEPETFSVLASKPQLGATASWPCEPLTITERDELEKATPKDFEFFRVVAPQ